MSNDAVTSEATAPQQDVSENPQLQAARDIKNTWVFEEKEYARYIVNRTGNIGLPIMHPVDKMKKVAILGCDFAWDDDSHFIDHLNLRIRDVRNVREDETIRERANLVTQNVGLFEETAQRGWLQKIGEFNEKSDPVDKTRSDMIGYPAEIRSDLVDGWLGNFVADRYFPPGTDDVDALLSEPESVFFLGKIGNYKSPSHILLFEFNTPVPDARRSYESDTLIAGQTTEGNTLIQHFMINNKAKLKFARKHLKNVQGASLAPEGALDFTDATNITPIGNPMNDIERETFKKMFNPNWMIRLADALADCFGFGGK